MGKSEDEVSSVKDTKMRQGWWRDDLEPDDGWRGEMDALYCLDGSCDAVVWVGKVKVQCTHPQHKKDARVHAWEAYHQPPEYSGLEAIIHSYGPITYSGIPRQGTITIPVILDPLNVIPRVFTYENDYGDDDEQP